MSAAKIHTAHGNVAGASDGYNAAVYAFGGSTFFALLLVGAGVALSPEPVSALPSLARQTGQPCAACHSAFPQLTPFGRRFKLEGYTAGGTRCGQSSTAERGGPQIPIGGQWIPSFTHIQKDLAPEDTPQGFNSNNNALPVQEALVTYAGQIYCNFGAFGMGTYERLEDRFFLEGSTDIRYANKTKAAGMDVVFGITTNNNPTTQDVWNTTPAWSFPFIAAPEALAPMPMAMTLLDTYMGRVVGTGVYIFANDSFYLEGTAYGTMDTRTLQALGLNPDEPPSRFDGLAPYWRAAYEKNWGYYSLMFGTFGMSASVAPLGNQSDPTDRLTDVGADAQFQYINDVHGLTARFSYIFEHQDLDGSKFLGLSLNSSNTLETLKVSASYVYDSIVSFTAGYFDIRGSKDPLLYPESMSPSALGSPDSNGWIFDLAWLPWSKGGPSFYPWLNARLGVSFTLYDQFNGASTNYNGAFRNANDNNTTFVYAWVAF